MISESHDIERVARRFCNLNLTEPCSEQPCEHHLAMAQVAVLTLIEDGNFEDKPRWFYKHLWDNRQLQKRTEIANGYGTTKHVYRTVHDPDEADLISSKSIMGDEHSPILDIDFPAYLYPSSTPGHYHLYLDRYMTWRKYKRLLRALYKAGIIEKPWYRMARRHKQTHLFMPDVHKSPGTKSKTRSYY